MYIGVTDPAFTFVLPSGASAIAETYDVNKRWTYHKAKGDTNAVLIFLNADE